MNSSNGDVAVARLNAAIGAFLDIMTAPEHTLVPVPEREPQPSLAERARVNLKPATDEVVRLAEEAAASANAAQNAADKANQITGLSTVFDAIELANVPLPDVWAPLTDNLRLLAGYGREVKVGNDVVASYLTYSRASGAAYIDKDGRPKTAAVNEPRFEREGILIEGQSTNLVPNPSDLTRWASKVGYAVTHDAAEKATKVVPLADGVAKAVICKQGAIFPDKNRRPLTVTVDVKPAGFDMVVIGFKGGFVDSPDNGIGVNINTGEVVRANHGLVISQVMRMANGYTRISVSAVEYSDSIDIYRDIVIGCGDPSLPYTAFSAPTADGVKGIYVRFVQCEEREHATSSIPAGSAPATRVTDTLTLPTQLNFPGSNGDMTVAIEVHRHPAIPSRMSQSIINIGNNINVSCTRNEFAAAGGSSHYARIPRPATGVTETVVFRIKGDEVSICCDGVISTVTRSGSLSANDAITRLGAGINGFNCIAVHLRNLRGWHHALSDVQMKAIK